MNELVARHPRILFARERLHDVWDEARELVAQNNDETGTDPRGLLNPDMHRYFGMEDTGVTRTFTIRFDRVLVGYANFFVVKHLHYANRLWAMQDALFVRKAHRGRTSIRFIRWTDEELAAEGVQMVMRHVSVMRDHSRVLSALGYQPQEVSYVRSLHGT